MACSQGSSVFDDLVVIAAKAPWWVGLGLAAVSFIVLHLLSLAFASANSATDMAGLSGAVRHEVIHTGAFFLQFILPPAFLIGACLSFSKRSRAARLFDDVKDSADSSVATLTWQQFETLMAEGFRRLGFSVKERGGAAADGGVDLVLKRGPETFLVQCKHWRAQQVPVTVVRELYGVMAAHHAAGGYVVTSGRFTREAAAFAQGRNIGLVDGAQLQSLLFGSTKPTLAPKPAEPIRVIPAATIPQCPQCHEPMVVRTARRGPNPGSEFWGCSRYPKCRGTRDKT